MAEFSELFPRTIWDNHHKDEDLATQLLVVSEELGEACEALRKGHGDKKLAVEVADVMIAASGLLHRLHDRTAISPGEFIERAHAKNRARGYYDTRKEAIHG